MDFNYKFFKTKFFFTLVFKVTDDEMKTYENIDFDPETFKNDIGCPSRLLRPTKEELLMNRWRFPSLSLHGIEGFTNSFKIT